MDHPLELVIGRRLTPTRWRVTTPECESTPSDRMMLLPLGMHTSHALAFTKIRQTSNRPHRKDRTQGVEQQ